MSKLELYSISKYIPADTVASLLEVDKEEEVSELSAYNWEDNDTLLDELVTFFPFPKFFNKKEEWTAVAETFTKLCQNGRLLIIRRITKEALPNIAKLINTLATALEESERSGRVCVVFEGLPGDTLTHEKKTFKVKALEGEPDKVFKKGTYEIKVSFRGNHKTYVDIALRVLRRRPWNNKLKISGLGNAIPVVVSVAEVLKRYQVVETESIITSLSSPSAAPMRNYGGKGKMVVILKKLHDKPQVYPTGVQES